MKKKLNSPTTPSCRNPEKPSKTRVFFRLAILYLQSETGLRRLDRVKGNVFLTGDRGYCQGNG